MRQIFTMKIKINILSLIDWFLSFCAQQIILYQIFFIQETVLLQILKGNKLSSDTRPWKLSVKPRPCDSEVQYQSVVRRQPLYIKHERLTASQKRNSNSYTLTISNICLVGGGSSLLLRHLLKPLRTAAGRKEMEVRRHQFILAQLCLLNVFFFT